MNIIKRTLHAKCKMRFWNGVGRNINMSKTQFLSLNIFLIMETFIIQDQKF